MAPIVGHVYVHLFSQWHNRQTGCYCYEHHLDQIERSLGYRVWKNAVMVYSETPEEMYWCYVDPDTLSGDQLDHVSNTGCLHVKSMEPYWAILDQLTHNKSTPMEAT